MSAGRGPVAVGAAVARVVLISDECDTGAGF
jgi:hypothetical protein